MIKKAGLKLQSAMEYLMTYGWAILIIAVVLGALFSLGVFNSASLTPQGCIALSGFYCQSPIFHQTSLKVSLGQATGTNWATTTLVFVLYGTTLTYPYTASNGEANTAVSGGLSSGAISSATFTLIAYNNIVTGVTNTIGTALQGSIYANYTTTAGGASTYYVTQMGTVSIKAT
jgi:hypothetical protein